MKPLFCICDKLCTSRAGLTLHQRICKEAIKAITAKKPAIKKSGIIVPEVEYLPEAKAFLELAEDIAFNMHAALSQKNKSAGRRSRTGLIRLRDMIIPIRKKILIKMGAKK